MNGIGELELRIKRYFKQSIIQFLKNDSNMDSSTSERAKVYRIAHYLENIIMQDDLFVGYVVDCDYNRVSIDDKIDIKRLPEDFYNDGNNHNNAFMADLIVHKRNSKDNLLYCEFKNSNESALDKKKTSLLTSGQHYIEYYLSTTIIFDKLNLDNIDDEVFFLENEKIKFMRGISFDEFLMIYRMQDITNLVNIRGRILFGEPKNLFDVYLWLDEIIISKLSVESRLEKLRNLKDYLYENSENIYKIIHKYDDVEICKIIAELKQMFSCHDLIEIKSRIHDSIYVKRSLLWDIYNLKLNGNSMEIISIKTGYSETVLRRIINQLRSEYRRVGIRIYLKLLIDKLCIEFNWSNDYLYTCKELEIATNKEIVKIVNFVYFLDCGNSIAVHDWSWFFIDNYNFEKRCNEIGYENLCKEINKNMFLSNKSKILLLKRLERYIDKDIDNDEDDKYDNYRNTISLVKEESQKILQKILLELKNNFIDFYFEHSNSYIRMCKKSWGGDDGISKIYFDILPIMGCDFYNIYENSCFYISFYFCNNDPIINKMRGAPNSSEWHGYGRGYSFLKNDCEESISNLIGIVKEIINKIDNKMEKVFSNKFNL